MEGILEGGIYRRLALAKGFVEEVWAEAGPELRAAIQQRWEACWADHRPPAEVPPRVALYGGQVAGGCSLSPFRWDVERRALVQAELDAFFARLYDLSRKQLRYTLDPADLTPHELQALSDPTEEVSDPLDGKPIRPARKEAPFRARAFGF